MAKYVNVINRKLSGRFVLEGRARLVRDLGDGVAVVDFEDGYGRVERFVDPAAQGDDLDAYLQRLNSVVAGPLT